MKNKLLNLILVFAVVCLLAFGNIVGHQNVIASAAIEEDLNYYTIYNSENDEILFLKGDSVFVNDEYISADNKLYVVESVDDKQLVGYARFVEDVEMPVFNIQKKNNGTPVLAGSNKRVGIYHTHNDECYNDADGTDSVYGKGGIHDVGLEFKKNLEALGIEVFYNESLHLPHDSGAYSRSLPTAKTLLQNDLDALFDVHRDATPRKEYITSVNGETMSKVRMVVGAANANSAVNKEFAITIKAYADEVYPGLIKDIYIGKGNYNQQLFDRAMLFEFGTNVIEKEYVLKSTKPLAKTLDVVLFGTQGAGEESLSDIDSEASRGDVLETGLAGSVNEGESTEAGLGTLWIVLISIAAIGLIFALVLIISPRARSATKRFFTELTAGIFKRKNKSKAN